jgi:dihydrofolate reductase
MAAATTPKQTSDDETLEYYIQLMRDVDLQVFGRKTYQLMVPFWPEVAKNQSDTNASNEFARTFDCINKIVFSRSLDSAEDRNTRIVRGNLHDEILKLNQERGKKYFGRRRRYSFTTYRAWSSG